MSKLTLNLDRCRLYYTPFIHPNVHIYRDKNTPDWLYVYGNSSSGILYAYRVYGTKDIDSCEEKDIPKEVSSYNIKTKYNTVELRVGTFYRINEFIDELGELTSMDDLIPTYNAEGFRVLHYENPDSSYVGVMRIYCNNISKHDDLAGAIISSLTLWNNKVSVSHDSWTANPNSWNMCGETFEGQMPSILSFITDIHKDYDIGEIQDNIIFKLIAMVICNRYASNTVCTYRKPKKRSPADAITNGIDQYDLDPEMYF